MTEYDRLQEQERELESKLLWQARHYTHSSK